MSQNETKQDSLFSSDLPVKDDVYTVTQALKFAKSALEKIRIKIVGEVSQFNDKPGYKAAYFTIRDSDCALPCIMWRERYRACGVVLRAGALVELTGHFSCYPKRGSLQFSVDALELAGEGRLRMQVARLAHKLELEGLMDPARKRPIPELPCRIALITSPRGKAVHDCIRTLRRRYPLAELMIFGVPVEGADAPEHMCDALRAAAAAKEKPDLILLVRGGGSYEDLMPFNDERLARAIVACPLPVITGIGHEPDNSIADMVGDLRASTPTAAAEAAAPSKEELATKLKNTAGILASLASRSVQNKSHSLALLANSSVWHDDHYLTGSFSQALDMAEQRIHHALPAAFMSVRQTLLRLEQQLCERGRSFTVTFELPFTQARRALLLCASSSCVPFERALALDAAKIDALSPLKILSRGYSITYGTDDSVIKSVTQVHKGESVRIRLHDGALSCSVTSTDRVKNE